MISSHGCSVSQFTWWSWQKPRKIVLPNWLHTCSPLSLLCRIMNIQHGSATIGHTGIRQQQQGTTQIDQALINQMFTGRAKHLRSASTIPAAQNCRALHDCSEVASPWALARICQAQGQFWNSGGRMRIPSASYTTKAIALSSIVSSTTYASKRLWRVSPSCIVPTKAEADCIPTEVVWFAKYLYHYLYRWLCYERTQSYKLSSVSTNVWRSNSQ